MESVPAVIESITGLTYEDKQPFTHIHTYEQIKVAS